MTGQDHPDVIVETATLASVVPPDPTYTIHSGVQVRAGVLAAYNAVAHTCLAPFEGLAVQAPAQRLMQQPVQYMRRDACMHGVFVALVAQG